MSAAAQLDLFACDEEERPAELDTWSDADQYAEGLRSTDYDPGHPWHYYMGGIGVRPEAVHILKTFWPVRLPKRGPKLDKMIAEARADMSDCLEKYRAIHFEGRWKDYRGSYLPGHAPERPKDRLAHCQGLGLLYGQLAYARAYLWTLKLYRRYPVT